eukprot:m.10302 g.10302  ORF g.10302 m.10302 type:complete len:681 (+) comp5586_c0_seq1:93-2135(+)
MERELWLENRPGEGCGSFFDRARLFLPVCALQLTNPSSSLDSTLLLLSSLRSIFDFLLESHCPRLWKACKAVQPPLFKTLVQFVCKGGEESLYAHAASLVLQQWLSLEADEQETLSLAAPAWQCFLEAQLHNSSVWGYSLLHRLLKATRVSQHHPLEHVDALPHCVCSPRDKPPRDAAKYCEHRAETMLTLLEAYEAELFAPSHVDLVPPRSCSSDQGSPLLDPAKPSTLHAFLLLCRSIVKYALAHSESPAARCLAHTFLTQHLPGHLNTFLSHSCASQKILLGCVDLARSFLSAKGFLTLFLTLAAPDLVESGRGRERAREEGGQEMNLGSTMPGLVQTTATLPPRGAALSPHAHAQASHDAPSGETEATLMEGTGLPLRESRDKSTPPWSQCVDGCHGNAPDIVRSNQRKMLLLTLAALVPLIEQSKVEHSRDSKQPQPKHHPHYQYHHHSLLVSPTLYATPALSSSGAPPLLLCATAASNEQEESSCFHFQNLFFLLTARMCGTSSGAVLADPAVFVDLFLDHDDDLVRGMHLLLQLSINASTSSDPPGSSPKMTSTSLSKSPPPLTEHTSVAPHSIFARPAAVLLSFVQAIGADGTVLLDLLLTHHTLFLNYLLCFFRAHEAGLVELLESEREIIGETFSQLHTTLTRLSRRDLFPFDAAPLLRRMSRFLESAED